MNQTNFPVHALTRRQALTGLAVAVGGLALSARAQGAKPPAMKEPSADPAHAKLTALHYECDYKAGPPRLYELLLDAKLFAALTGPPAEIDRRDGGAFALFGGLIVGRNVELIANQRIVQAWRPASGWPAGAYSIVRFEFQERGAQTRMTLDHRGFPEGFYDHLDFGWKVHYLDPLAQLLN